PGAAKRALWLSGRCDARRLSSADRGKLGGSGEKRRATLAGQSEPPAADQVRYTGRPRLRGPTTAPTLSIVMVAPQNQHELVGNGVSLLHRVAQSPLGDLWIALDQRRGPPGEP